MKKLTFEKYGLSPEKVEELRVYKNTMISYTPKEHGWAEVIISNGTAEIAFVGSHLHDSRQDLIRSVATLEKYKEATVVFQDEPDGSTTLVCRR
ncbi:hypothetical protein [Capnocytophaga gingivalis]